MRKSTAANLSALVKRNYKDIAPHFNITRQKEISAKIKAYCFNVKDGDRVLDAACGNGRLLEALKGKRIDYLGFDSNEELLHIARENYPGYDFLAGDLLKIDQLDLGAETFDRIFFLAVWPHIPGEEGRREVLKNLGEKLSPAGEMTVSVWNLRRRPWRRLLWRAYFKKIFGRGDWDAGDLIFPWKDASGQAISQRYYHAFRRRELFRLVKAAGLEVKTYENDGRNYWLRLVKPSPGPIRPGLTAAP